MVLLLLGLLLALTPATLSTGALLAQGCGEGVSSCGTSGHTNYPDELGDVQNPHEDCIQCVLDNQPREPEECHPTPCIVPFEEDSAEYEAYMTVLDAARHGDPRAVLIAAPRVATFVVYNEARRAVQILSCDNETIWASLPVRSASVERLAIQFAMYRATLLETDGR